MISKVEARKLEGKLIREGRENSGRSSYARETKVQQCRRGVCHLCGCKVYKTEWICGECLCEEDY